MPSINSYETAEMERAWTTNFAQLIAKQMPQEGMQETAIPSLRLFRSSAKTSPIPSVFKSVLCVLAQGRKQLLAGTKVYPYSTNQFVVVTTDLPLSGQITEASRELPYLGLRLKLDFMEVNSLIDDEGTTRKRGRLQIGLLGSRLHSLIVCIPHFQPPATWHLVAKLLSGQE